MDRQDFDQGSPLQPIYEVTGPDEVKDVAEGDEFFAKSATHADFEVTEEEVPVNNSVFGRLGAVIPLIVTLPFEVVRTLVKLGHEPLPAQIKSKGWGLFGTKGQGMFLPNGFAYAKHLKRTYGWKAMYRPLPSKIFEVFIENAVRSQARAYFSGHFDIDLDATPREEELSYNKAALRHFLKGCVGEATAASVATVASFPFSVIFERCIAELVVTKGGLDGNGYMYCNPFDLWTLVTDSSLPDLIESLKPRVAYSVIAALSVYSMSQVIARVVPYTVEEAEKVCTNFLGDIERKSREEQGKVNDDGYLSDSSHGKPAIDSDSDNEFDMDELEISLLASTRYGQLACGTLPVRFIQYYLYPLLHVSTRMAVVSSNSIYKHIYNGTAGSDVVVLQRYASWRDCYEYLCTLGTSRLFNGYALLNARLIQTVNK
eukprot:CFRG3135T1